MIVSEWKRKFTEHTTRVAFNLTLTRKMIFFMEVIERFNEMWTKVHDPEYLTQEGLTTRNDFVPGFHYLERRGLAEHNPIAKTCGRERVDWIYRLTPAGEQVMVLLRLTGLVTSQPVNQNKPRRKRA